MRLCGRSNQKEAYAFFYNTETVEFVDDYVYDDTDDVFEREPYVATFRSGNFDFTIAGIHTKPDNAESEIGGLAGVFSSVLTMNPDENDIIVMGDFNADGDFFDENDSPSTFKAPEYYWMISNDMDTMVISDWTYDRIVMADTTFEHEYVDGSAAVFYFDQEYGIDDQDLIRDVSDHYPVYAVFKTDLPDDDTLRVSGRLL